MIARPAVAAFGCRNCQTAIYRAVLSAPSRRGVPFNLAPRFPASGRRAFSLGRPLHSQTSKDDEGLESELAHAAAETEPGEEASGRPWFLDVDPPRHPSSDHKPDLPKVPDDAPPILDPVIKYVYEDMGLDDLSLLDLRELDPSPALGPNLIMLFGTARSERHLHVSAGRFVKWLRRNYRVEAGADGLIGPGELRTKLRRLRKKAKLMGTNTAIVPGGDNGISTGWICVNFSAEGEKAGESVSFDDSGRFSGFGTPRTGTTVVVQCLTEARRAELDLEALWRGVLKRSLEGGKRVRGEAVGDAAAMDALLSTRIQLPKSGSALQWQAMRQASQKQYFSTVARRLQSNEPRATPQAEEASNEEAGNEEAGRKETAGSYHPDLATLRHYVGELQAVGKPMSEQGLEKLISAIFQAVSSRYGSEVQRLALVDGLLLTAQERGMTVLSKCMLVNLIESVVASPAYGPELQRSQRNFEFLLTEMQVPLEPAQVLRLMAVYAARHDWDRLLNTFRTPPRFLKSRTPEQYALLFRTLAAAGGMHRCVDTLRWAYPEMLREDPPVLPVGAVYDSLKACILVADPAAEHMMTKSRYPSTLLAENRKWAYREFMRVLKHAEEVRARAASAGMGQQLDLAASRLLDEAESK